MMKKLLSCNRQRSIFLIIPVIISTIALSLAVFFFVIIKLTQKSPLNSPIVFQTTPFPQKQARVAEDFDVLVKENPNDKAKSDVYLKDKENGEETFFITLTDVNRPHYHKTEYHYGYLYIIRRTGGEDGYRTNPNWTDELWRYNREKQGTKLYSVRGLDFRVNNSDTLLAILDQDKLVIYDLDKSRVILEYFENQIKSFADRETSVKLASANLSILQWDKNKDVLWGEFNLMAYSAAFWKLDMESLKAEVFSVPSDASRPDLNTEKEVLAYTDRPVFLDIYSADDWLKTHKSYSIYLYYLRSKKRVLADILPSNWPEPSNKLIFNWASPNQLRYFTPQGEKTYTLPE